MQIPPTSAAVQAAGGTVAQAAKEHSAAAPDALNVNAAQVEQSGTADPDRDAQGQGDGLGERPSHQHAKEDVLELGGAPQEIAHAESTNVPDAGGLDLMA